MTIMAYVGRVSDCGLDLLGVHDVARDRDRLPVLMPMYLGARLLVGGVLMIAIVLLGLFAFPQPEGAIMAALAFTLGPIALGTRWVHLGLEQTRNVSIARATAEVLTALLIIATVHGTGDAARVPVAQIIGESVGAFLLLRALPSVSVSLRELFRVDVVRTIYRRSWPLVLNALLGLVLFNSDFVFLRLYRDSATVGHYAVAYTLISFVVNLGNSYTLTLLPAVTRLRDDRPAERRLYHNALAQVFAVGLPIAIGGCLVAHLMIPLFFGEAYRSAVLPLQILVWSLPVALTRHVVQGLMIAHGRQKQMLQTSSWAAASNLALNASLIPILGMAGAAVVTVLTEVIRTLPMLRILHTEGLTIAPPSRFWRTLLAGATMAAVVALGRFDNMWLLVATGAVVYALTLYMFGGIRLRGRALPELSV
jgi:O-antigen/teichoic acid export membrane protein